MASPNNSSKGQNDRRTWPKIRRKLCEAVRRYSDYFRTDTIPKEQQEAIDQLRHQIHKEVREALEKADRLHLEVEEHREQMRKLRRYYSI